MIDRLPVVAVQSEGDPHRLAIPAPDVACPASQPCHRKSLGARRGRRLRLPAAACRPCPPRSCSLAPGCSGLRPIAPHGATTRLSPVPAGMSSSRRMPPARRQPVRPLVWSGRLARIGHIFGHVPEFLRKMPEYPGFEFRRPDQSKTSEIQPRKSSLRVSLGVRGSMDGGCSLPEELRASAELLLRQEAFDDSVGGPEDDRALRPGVGFLRQRLIADGAKWPLPGGRRDRPGE